MSFPHDIPHPRNDGLDALDPAAARIFAELLEARLTATALTGFPGSPPLDLRLAYQIQSHLISHWPDDLAGWKVGGIPEANRDEYLADMLVGPIFAKSIKRSKSSSVAQMPVFGGGFAAIEPELVIELGQTRLEDRMFVGVEIASSPVPAINDYGPAAVVCDFGNNNGLLIGEEIEDWINFKGPIEVATWIDGQLVGERSINDRFASARSARDFCLDLCGQFGRQVLPGTLISTGAITGVHEVQPGEQGKILFSSSRSVEMELVCVNRSA